MPTRLGIPDPGFSVKRIWEKNMFFSAYIGSEQNGKTHDYCLHYAMQHNIHYGSAYNDMMWRNHVYTKTCLILYKMPRMICFSAADTHTNNNDPEQRWLLQFVLRLMQLVKLID